MSLAPERYPNVFIRPMRDGDVPACAAIVGETPFWREHFAISTLRAETLLQGGMDRKEGLLVADDHGTTIGFAWFLMRGGFGRSGFLRSLGVRADRRNHHAGSALLQAVESAVGDDLFVLVPDFNEGAVRFYEKHGYQQVGRLPGFLLPESTEIILWRRKLAGML